MAALPFVWCLSRFLPVKELSPVGTAVGTILAAAMNQSIFYSIVGGNQLGMANRSNMVQEMKTNWICSGYKIQVVFSKHFLPRIVCDTDYGFEKNCFLFVISLEGNFYLRYKIVCTTIYCEWVSSFFFVKCPWEKKSINRIFPNIEGDRVYINSIFA